MSNISPDILLTAFNLPPEKAVKLLKSKGMKFSWDWRETWQGEHAKAFTVAKAMQTDVLLDIRESVQKALSEGITLDQFKTELIPKLQERGWWGKQEVGGGTAQLGSLSRLETIYRTNTQAGYLAGRYKASMDVAVRRPYWQYIAVMDSVTRAEHAALHLKIFRFDDPFWDAFYPPNGFNCRCYVGGLSDREIERDGLRVSDSEGKLQDSNGLTYYTDGNVRIAPDVGWNYNVGKSAYNLDVLTYSKISELPLQIQYDFMSAMTQTGMRVAAFSAWTDGVAAGKASSEINHVAGWIDAKTFQYAELKGVKPISPVVIAENDLTSKERIEKGAAAFTGKEYRDIPDYLSNPESVLHDQRGNAFIYVVDSDDAVNKNIVRVEINKDNIRKPVNRIVATGKISPSDLSSRNYQVAHRRTD